jgi:hypothetical protein
VSIRESGAYLLGVESQLRLEFDCSVQLAEQLREPLRKLLAPCTGVLKVRFQFQFYWSKFFFYGAMGLVVTVLVKSREFLKERLGGFDSFRTVNGMLVQAGEICGQINRPGDKSGQVVLAQVRAQYPKCMIVRSRHGSIAVGDAMAVWMDYLSIFNRQFVKGESDGATPEDLCLLWA